jgi:tetratricopeptide (TPR) repeat protein
VKPAPASLAARLCSNYYRGSLAKAEKYFIQGLKFFDHPSFRRAPGVAVGTFSYASYTAWMLGNSDVARERMARVMAAANNTNPYEVVFSGRFAAELSVYIRQGEQAEAMAARALELSEKHEFGGMAAVVQTILGYARAHLGHPADGIGLIRRGISGSLELGEHVGISQRTAWLADAQDRTGAIGDALETVESALQMNPDELLFRPEALTIRGALRFKQAQAELAETDFREAISLAQTMSAKSWQLRATMSLSRLLRDTDRRDEARAMLAAIYGWFTEGFDTADLIDAKALLDELSV